MTRIAAGRTGSKLLKPTDDIPGWTDEQAPAEMIKKTRDAVLSFNQPGSACCLCWQAFGPGERIRVYTFPSGTRLWFHHGTCWRDWWIDHEPVIQAARVVEASESTPVVSQAAIAWDD